jgi:CDP-glucose 4,6-dehydratase
MTNLLDTYKDKRVLITGHTGFKGSWLSIWLNKLGAQVAGFSLSPYTSDDNYVVTGIENEIKSYIGDLRDFESLSTVFKEFRPEIVFHLAAQTLVLESYSDPKYTFDTNVGGLVNLLEACNNCDSVRTIVVVTSDKCYDNKEWLWGYRENDPMGGVDPYSASKGVAELICSSWRSSFFYEESNIAIATARAGNVVGGGDWSENRLVPDCIKAININKEIEIRNPYSTRPWQFVLEPLWGYLLLGAKLAYEPDKYAEAWNFGPDIQSVLPVSDIVELIIKHYKKGNWNYCNTDGAHHEAKLLAIDYSKSYFRLGWQPTLNVGECIKFTTEWYEKFSAKNHKMIDICLEQIDLFSKKIILHK